MLFSLLLFTLCFAKCRKDKLPTSGLPSATQEGRNTIGFTINREVWVPYAKCGFGQNPCGEIHADYSIPSTSLNSIDYMFRRSVGLKSSSLYISSVMTGTITSVGEKTDSIGVEYRDDNLSNDGYFVGPIPGSKFTITKIDFSNQIISGAFELILKERKNTGTVTNNLITLKDGRFDLKFNACKCSN